MTDEAALLLRDDRADGVTVLTLNRPAQFNSLSLALLGELQLALDTIATTPAIRVVDIAGAGKAFCAGHDLREMRGTPEKAFMQKLFKAMARVCTTLQRLPQPVIARIHGVATAAGCQLVASCDLAVAAQAVRFGVNGIDVGLFCSTPAVALSRAVPRKSAFEMLVTGDFITAPEAQRLGLINRAVAAGKLEAETMALAQKIAAKLPAAIAMGKRSFYEQLGHDTADAYEAAADTMVANMMLSDTDEGINAFLEKRRPAWAGDLETEAEA